MFNNLIAKLKCNRGETPIGDTKVIEKSGADTSSQPGEKLDGLVQDVNFDDIKDLPEDAQKKFIEKFTQKTKLYDAGFRTKMEDYATKEKALEAKSEGLRDLEKLQTEIQGNPDFEKVINKTINDFRAGKISTEKQVDKSLSKIDQLIQDAESADQREQLKTMREIIKQEAPVGGASSEQIKNLEDKIARLEQSATAGLQGGIKTSIQTLKDSFGEEIVTKYDGQIREMLAKYPTYLDTPSKVLFSLAKESEIFDAYEKIKVQKTKVENKRKADGTFPGGESKPTAIDIPRDKGGRVNWSKYAENLQSAGKFD